jgi:prolyl 4-hydroxylase
MHALSDYIRYYDNALPADFCKRMVDAFEQMRDAHVVNGQGVRAGLEKSRWTELNMSRYADDAMKGFFFDQIERALDRYNQELGLGLPIPGSQVISELVIKRYAMGGTEGFQPHFDSMYDKANRYLVLLWYLNDVREGGATRFTDLDIEVQARAGRLLIFPPYWMYQHAGLPPISNDKYIVSTYLLFENHPALDATPSRMLRA